MLVHCESTIFLEFVSKISVINVLYNISNSFHYSFLFGCIFCFVYPWVVLEIKLKLYKLILPVLSEADTETEPLNHGDTLTTLNRFSLDIFPSRVSISLCLGAQHTFSIGNTSPLLTLIAHICKANLPSHKKEGWRWK